MTLWFLSLSFHSICDFFTILAGAECDAEPPVFPPRALGGHSVRVQPDHSGPGGGSACGSAQRHRGPAAVQHEDLPRPPAGQPASLITRQPATQRIRIRTLTSPPSTSLHMQMFALLLFFPPLCVLVRLAYRPVRLCRCRRTACWLSAASSSFKTSVPFDKLVCLRRSHIVNPGGGQDNQGSNSAACSLEQIGIQLKYFSTQKAKAKRKRPRQRQHAEKASV